ncbi:MAG TPA: hypothetical protein ENJ14_02400 [Bacteroidetes bacterium]|nr:hypothetical protein [Bacteroidota bacterium]
MTRVVKISVAAIVWTLIVFLAVSCSVEKKLAMDFVQSNNSRHVLVFSTDQVFKVNQKRELLDSLKITDESIFDSVLYANSGYLQYINDSLFLANYVLGYLKEMETLGFHVYKESQTLEFLNLDSNAYVANIAQIEIEETIYDYRAGEEIFGEYYYYDFELNALIVNSWIELKEYNKTGNGEQLYFATDMITDDFDGEFYTDLFAGEVRFAYNVDTLETEDLYNFAYLLGRKYASYTIDWMVNKYLDENIPEGKRSDNYWRYDPYRKEFYPEEEDRFIPMDE